MTDDGARAPRTSYSWLVAGWACALIWLAALPVIALFGIFGLAFCDAPGAPCGAYALVDLALLVGYFALLFLIVRGLIRQRFTPLLRLIALVGATAMGGCAMWLARALTGQA